jgi:hypothetical protein
MPQTGSTHINISAKDENFAFDRLISLAEDKLNAAIKRCHSLPMYKNKWSLHGFNIKRNFRLTDLKNAPLITREDLVAGSNNISHKSYARNYIHLWNKSCEQGDASYWAPRGRDDVMYLLHQSGRIARLLELKDSDCVLFLNQPAFGAANLLPHAMAQWLKTEGTACQVITMDMDLLEYVAQWVGILSQNQPTVMIAQSEDALKLSVMLAKFNNTAAANVGGTAYDGSKILPELRLIMLYGRYNIGKQAEVESIYNTDTLLSIGLADDGIDAMECQAHKGVHLWLDKGLYEIIPDGYDVSANTSPVLPWIWETKAGTCGELVVTTFSELLPLVRYRSGYRIETMGSDACSCGHAHPRVKLL